MRDPGRLRRHAGRSDSTHELIAPRYREKDPTAFAGSGSCSMLGSTSPLSPSSSMWRHRTRTSPTTPTARCEGARPMAEHPADPAAAIPEVDLLEQITPADADEVTSVSPEAVPLLGDRFIDEADLLEQSR